MSETKNKVVKEIMRDPRRSKNIVVPKKTKDETREQEQRREMLEEYLLRACMAEGMSRDEICYQLEMTPSELGSVEVRLQSFDLQREIVKTVPQRYYEYALKQEQCVRDLDGVVDFVRDEITEYMEERRRYKEDRARYDGYVRQYEEDCRKMREVFETEVDEEGNFLHSITELHKAMPPMPKPPQLPHSTPPISVAAMAIKAKSTIFEQTIKTGQELGIIPKRAKEIRVSGSINLAAMPTDALKSLLEKRLSSMQQLVTVGTIPQTYLKKMEQLDNGTTGSPGRVLDGRGQESGSSTGETVGRAESVVWGETDEEEI